MSNKFTFINFINNLCLKKKDHKVNQVYKSQLKTQLIYLIQILKLNTPQN